MCPYTRRHVATRVSRRHPPHSHHAQQAHLLPAPGPQAGGGGGRGAGGGRGPWRHCRVRRVAARHNPGAPPSFPRQLRAAEDAEGHLQFFEENPRLPYKGAKIMSSQPQFLRDFASGLNTTMFR